MHEMALMASIFEIIQDAVAKNQVNKVNKVVLVVGELTNVVEGALTLAFEAYSKGTPCEGARLVIKKKPLEVTCRLCKTVSRPRDYIFTCSGCGSAKVDVTSGRELHLEYLEAD